MSGGPGLWMGLMMILIVPWAIAIFSDWGMRANNAKWATGVIVVAGVFLFVVIVSAGSESRPVSFNPKPNVLGCYDHLNKHIECPVPVQNATR